MDRDRIERRDFPTGRRGYDPAAVDEHLRRVADEFEARVHPPPPARSMASSTSEQVRLILEAAERGAAELRTAAGTEASDHVTRVQTAADGMLAKLDALESELNRLLSALRTSGERLAEGLAELQAQAASGLGATESGVVRPQPDELGTRAAEPAIDPLPADSPRPAADPEPATTPPADAGPSDHDSPPLSAPDAPDWPAPTGALFDSAPAEDSLFAPAGDGSEPDDAGARLIALNMVLSGFSRDDTRVFLEEHFSGLPDVEALLDDVYARAGR